MGGAGNQEKEVENEPRMETRAENDDRAKNEGVVGSGGCKGGKGTSKGRKEGRRSNEKLLPPPPSYYPAAISYKGTRRYVRGAMYTCQKTRVDLRIDGSTRQQLQMRLVDGSCSDGGRGRDA